MQIINFKILDYPGFFFYLNGNSLQRIEYVFQDLFRNYALCHLSAITLFSVCPCFLVINPYFMYPLQPPAEDG